jgi:hypothetical protein
MAPAQNIGRANLIARAQAERLRVRNSFIKMIFVRKQKTSGFTRNLLTT